MAEPAAARVLSARSATRWSKNNWTPGRHAAMFCTEETEETSALYPHLDVRAKIVFANGVVKEWQRFDRPAY